MLSPASLAESPAPDADSCSMARHGVRPGRRLSDRGGEVAVGPASDVAEPVDRALVARPQLGVAHAEALLGGEAKDADLALVEVAVDVVRRLAGLLERVGPG